MIFSKKSDGDMKNKKYLKDFCKKKDINYESIISCNQVHKNLVQEVGKKDRGKALEGTDGLVTKSKDVILAIFVADCIPILFKSKTLCGVLHCGWRGIYEGIIERGISIAEKLEGNINKINFEIGPGIGKCHFEVKEDIIEMFASLEEIDNIDFYIFKKNNRKYLDLKELAKNKIKKRKGKKIKISSICTYCNKNYFSYRRDNTQKRMVVLNKI